MRCVALRGKFAILRILKKLILLFVVVVMKNPGRLNPDFSLLEPMLL